MRTRRLVSRKTLGRFLRYSLVGSSTFPIDLALLFVLVFYLDVHYLVATGIAFIAAVTLNYLVNRPWAFYGTRRGFFGGYAYFILIGGTAAALTVALTGFITSYFEVHYLLARVAIAGFVGLGGFLANLYVTFRLAEGQDEELSAPDGLQS